MSTAMAEAHKEAHVSTVPTASSVPAASSVPTASSTSSRVEGPSVPSTFTAYSGSRYPIHMYIYELTCNSNYIFHQLNLNKLIHQHCYIYIQLKPYKIYIRNPTCESCFQSTYDA